MRCRQAISATEENTHDYLISDNYTYKKLRCKISYDQVAILKKIKNESLNEHVQIPCNFTSYRNQKTYIAKSMLCITPFFPLVRIH